MKSRALAAWLFIGLVGAWATSATAQVNALAGRVTADVTNSTTTFQNVTGLSWYAAANASYAFECDISYTTAATTTALQLSVNGPAAPTAVRFAVTTPTSATTMFFASESAYEANTNPGSSLDGTALPVTIAGVIENGANAGTVAIRFRSEVGGSAVTIQRGSSCKVYR